MTLIPVGRWRIALLALPVLLVAGWFAWQAFQRPEVPPTTAAEPFVTDPLEVPPRATSPYLNTSADTRFIGTAACVACHPKNHASYLHTPHSRALADLDQTKEPPDGTFEHKLSGRTYRVHRENGVLWHEETLKDEKGRVVARMDYPIRYLIGSGHFTRTYLIEVGGFLHESPVTWYTTKGRYDMSPGYDFPVHGSFERVVTQGCLHCHSGGAAAAAGGVNRLTIREQAVGCESCHGPGSTHADFHTAKKKLDGPTDFTIVNPGKLDRPLLEAMCGECHLGSVASVRVRGRQPGDFRPGLPLSDHRIDYRIAGGTSQMTVTGHLEQLRQSTCYAKSEMTCLTCHDPHLKQPPADLAAHHRQQCLTCHTPDKCKSPAADRAKTAPADNCVQCHMPKGDTDIPHLAFTHHRVGVHRPKGASGFAGPPTLEPIGDESGLTAADRKRNLGLAYLLAMDKEDLKPFAAEYEKRGLALLEQAYALGVRDPDTTAWLARLHAPKNQKKAAAFAEQTLAAADAHPEQRSYALMILANAAYAEKKYPQAIERLTELVRIRRQADDWRLLGDCYLFSDRLDDAVAAFRTSLEIRPFRPTTHAGLAETYRRQNKPALANEHQRLSDWLYARRQE